jgi:hypothetical protein
LKGLFTQADPSADPQIRIDVDTQSRPVHAALSDGSTIDLLWKSDQQANITFTSADGKSTNSIDFTFAHLRSKSGAIAHATPITLDSSLILTVLADNSVPQTAATVWAKVTPLSLGPDHSGFRVPLSEVGNGQYAGGFPNFPSSLPLAAINSVCSSTVEFIGNACEVLSPAAEDMVQGGCSAAPNPAVCVAAFTIVEKACPVVAASTSGGAETVCNGIQSVLEFFSPDGVHISAGAKKWGREGESSVDVGGATTQVEMTILLPPRRYDATTADSGTCRDSGNISTFGGEFEPTSDPGKFIITIAGKRYTVNAPGTTNFASSYPEAGGTTNETIELQIGDSGTITGNGHYSGTYPNPTTGSTFSCAGGYTISGGTTRIK